MICSSKRAWLVYFALFEVVSAYSPIGRWGQATAVINNALFIQGGKTDQYNSYSYTSAPNINDLLFLPLSSPFDISSAPWELLSCCSNSSTSQGPVIAWHTLSAINTTEILVFGGQPGPNSAIVLPDQADSAELLNIYDELSPSFLTEALSWAGEPIRRMHHSTCSSGGKVYIFGGEKADGSGIAFSDNYVFDPNIPSFTQLPSANGPPDMTGHTCIVLENGLLLVFGGYSPSLAQLISFTTIWALNTTSATLEWTSISVSNLTVPAARRAFAAVFLATENKILIHGGADADLLNAYNDGWILDATQNPMVWSEVGALAQLGDRYDHFAVALGTQVIFGFGYTGIAPAPGTVQIFDMSSNSWAPSFSPPPIGSATSYTLPGPTQTSKPGSGSPSNGNPPGTGTNGGSSPTSSAGSGNTGGGGQTTGASSTDHITAIAVGATLGALALVTVGVLGMYYVRTHMRNEQRFSMIGDEETDGEASPHFDGPIPGLGVLRDNRPTSGGGGWNQALKNTLAFGILSNTSPRPPSGESVRELRERRDILADEDTRVFNPSGSLYGARAQESSAGSTWSLRSVGVLLGAGFRGNKSREPSTLSVETPQWEKADPFRDSSALIGDEEAGYLGPGAASRPRGGREASHMSSQSGRSYVDPFEDPIHEEARQQGDLGNGWEGADESVRLVQPQPQPVLPPLQTMLPLSVGLHSLSPVTERTSRNSLSNPSLSNPSNQSVSSHSHSHEQAVSPFEGTVGSSHTSLDNSYFSSARRRSSILDTAPTQGMRRSDSWWSRFSRTAFLDRRSSDGARSRIIDIRDPNPIPRLTAIEEKSSSHSGSPDSPNKTKIEHAGSQHSRRNSRAYGGMHGRSQSSLQTARTADSEAIERMGRMDVVQRIIEGSHCTKRSTGSTGTGYGTEGFAGDLNIGDVGMVMHPDAAAATMVTSPTEMTPAEYALKSTTPPVSNKSSPQQTPSPASTSSASIKRLSTSGAVAARVRAYERRMSQEVEAGQVPLSPGAREARSNAREEPHAKPANRVSVNYGLVPRPSLFVANPDHRSTPSAGS